MAEHDDDEQKPTLDPDRAAILERRKRFIALALSGLSTACTAGPAQTKPDPCLKTVPRQNEEEDGDETAAPHPCLSVPIQPDPGPQVCLKMAQPPAPPPADTGEDETGEAAPEPTPQPCLSKPAPKPCLKIPPPQPCLKMAQPE